MQPEDYPRRVLLCALGRTPQLVTETLYALACTRTPAFVPTEIRLITTLAGREAALQHLGGAGSQLRRLCEQHRLAPPRFDADCIHVLGEREGRALADIRSPEDNISAADDILALVRDLTRDTAAALHVSLAGGRKTMGFYIGYALSFFGRIQDRLSHVLVNAPFEELPEFFFPPVPPATLQMRNGQTADTREAHIALAEIPFLHLSAGLPAELLAGAASFREVVALANAHLQKPLLEIDKGQSTVRCGGKWVELPPQLFAVYAWMADRRRRLGDASAVGARELRTLRAEGLQDLLRWLRRYSDMHPFHELADTLAAPEADAVKWFREKVSHCNRLLRRTLGPLGLAIYGVHAISRQRGDSRCALTLAADCIQITGPAPATAQRG